MNCIIKTFVVNIVGENCYVISDDSREAVIIDCGASRPSEYAEITDYIELNELHPVAHLLTHAHFDHILGAGFIEERYGLQPRCHAADLPLLTGLPQQYQDFLGIPFRDKQPTAGAPLDAFTTVTFGTHALQVIPCPGHTPGGICLYCPEEQILFSGDSLFRFSIGRTDLPGGHHWTLITSLKHLLSAIPPATTVYPGHGPTTTIATEQTSNPYLSYL